MMWFGKLPEQWEAHRLKMLVTDINSKTNPRNQFYIGMENISSWSACFLETGLEADGDSKEFTKGDVLFGKLRPYLAKVYVHQKDGACSGEFLVLRGYKGNASFLKYQLLAYEFISLVNASTYGAKMPRTNWQFVGNCLVPFPSRYEQDQIVRYLDWKVSMIDKYINAKKKQIELLKEQKQAVIGKMLTNEHGQKIRFRYLFKLYRGLNITKTDLTDVGVPCVSYGEIHSRYGFEVSPDIHPLKCVDKRYLQTNSVSLMKYGDFVFADTSENTEGSGNFTYLNSNTQVFAGYHTIIARAVEVMNYRYLAYFLIRFYFGTKYNKR